MTDRGTKKAGSKSAVAAVAVCALLCSAGAIFATSDIIRSTDDAQASYLAFLSVASAPTPSPTEAPEEPVATVAPTEAPKEADPKFEDKVYVVQDGDTIESIAEELGVDPTELAEYNELEDGEELKPGDELKIPPRDGGTGEGSDPAKPEVSPEPVLPAVKTGIDC